MLDYDDDQVEAQKQEIVAQVLGDIPRTNWKDATTTTTTTVNNTSSSSSSSQSESQSHSKNRGPKSPESRQPDPTTKPNKKSNHHKQQQQQQQQQQINHLTSPPAAPTSQKEESLLAQGVHATSNLLHELERRVFLLPPPRNKVHDIMKTNLSHILPAHDACEVLGEPTVRRIVRSFLKFRFTPPPSSGNHHSSSSSSSSSLASFESHNSSSPASSTKTDHLSQEESQLVKALFYQPNNKKPNGSTFDSKQQQQQQPQLPPMIQKAWSKMTNISGPLAIDKITFLKFAVPACNAPHAGQGGHLGLFDCVAHALQASSQQQQQQNSTTIVNHHISNQQQLSSSTNVILLPDILIFFAICRGHSALQRDMTDTDGYGTMLLAVMAFRVYDSYQKRGTVSRDTIHKFLSDVHGDESYKAQGIRKTLDAMFTIPESPADRNASTLTGGVIGRVVSSLTASQFCNGVSETLEGTNHVLLDWVATVGSAMLPPIDIPPSTSAYVEAIQSSHRSTSRICQKYGLAEGRLYEIKRRFHSMVESSNVLIEVGADGHLPMTEQEGAGASSHIQDNRPRHVITQDAFVKSVSKPNDELGHGGYLPEGLAKLTFRGGCSSLTNLENIHNTGSGADASSLALSSKSTQQTEFWTLYDVLLLGCEGVRIDTHKRIEKFDEQSTEEDFLRFVFRTFCLVPRLEDVDDKSDKKKKKNQNASTSVATSTSTSSGGDDDSPLRLELTRSQVGKMLLLLLDHAAFREEVDSSPIVDDEYSEHSEQQRQSPYVLVEDNGSAAANMEDTLVNVTAASIIGILPNNKDLPQNEEMIPLSLLIDYVFEEALSSLSKDDENDGQSEGGKQRTDALTFESFCRWHYNTNDPEHSLPVYQQRLGPYLLELRLVFSVLFGIPPSRATTEKMILEELQRRHKYRYPQTEVSRRGPRGTIWFIIDNRWYTSWQSFVSRHHEPADDAVDGRATMGPGSPRGLGKINNAGLLSDGGSLALRPSIRWRHDYDIISPTAWSALQGWYDGGPPIHRSVVRYVPSESAKNPHSKSNLRIRTEHEIELYPFFVTVFLCDAASRGEARPFQQAVPVSRVSPVRIVVLEMCKGLDLDPKYARLWVMGSNPNDPASGADTSSGGNGKGDWLLNLDVNIVDQQNRMGEKPAKSNSLTLLLEIKDEETGKWPRGYDGKHWVFKDTDPNKSVRNDALVGDGIVGLYNMGNTCYLNSSVQCLSHTPIFRDYFTSKAYMNDINTTNPLGYEGRLAQVSAVLINSLWKRFAQSFSHPSKRVTVPGSYAPVNAPALTPKTFKEAMGKFNDHFAGNEQHDAQELLAFLLGGLSEDLNRIVDKPYIEAPDSDGRPDRELADIWWSNHLKREMSIIVALFTGQYKSLLTCRSCKYESARFEPFSFLQLPLPEDDHIPVSLILYPREDGADTMKYSVRVPHNGRLLDVLMALAKVRLLDDPAEYIHDDADAVATATKTKEDPEEEDERRAKLEKVHDTMAQNMAVVDMRDGYIFKIAPNSWALPDLQNKDTGELPLLHVYELEPLPEVDHKTEDSETVDDVQPENEATPDVSGDGDKDDEDDSDNDTDGDDDSDEDTDGDDDSDEDTDDGNPPKPTSKIGGSIGGSKQHPKKEPLKPKAAGVKYSFLAIAQRKPEILSPHQLHPFAQRIVGTPLLLRVVDLEGYSGKDLYDLIAKRVRNLVPKSAWRFLDPANAYAGSDDSDDSSLTDSEPSARERKHRLGSRQRRRRTNGDMEIVAAGPVPRYGFRIRITSRDGRRCALCPWYDSCIGCLVPDDDYPTIAMCGDSLAIDWHFAVDIATFGFGMRNQTEGTAITPALRAKTTGVPVKNHISCAEGANKNGMASAITLEDCLDSFAKEEKIPEAYCSMCKDFRVQTKRMSLWRLPPVVIIQLKRFQFTQHMRRKLRDLVTFPVEGLDLSRIMAESSTCTETNNLGNVVSNDNNSDAADINKAATEEAFWKGDATSSTAVEADEFDDDNTSKKSTPPLGPDSTQGGAGNTEMLYDLYGVVHHQGALSGGHYVASLKSDDGQWRLFNDAQVYEIHSRDVVDSSAYILFYIRRDVKDASLSDFWDASAREGEGLTEEEVENLMKNRSDRCVIS